MEFTGLIKKYPKGRPKHYKREPKFYSFQRNAGKFTVRKRNVYYGSFKREKEARRCVELLKECDWDKKEMPNILNKINQEIMEGAL